MHLILTQCFPPTLGGIETLMGGLATALCDAGEAVVVLADGAPTEADAAHPAEIRRFDGWKPLRRRAKARAAAELIAAGGVTRIFCDSWKSAALTPPRSETRPHVVCLAHGMEFPSRPGPIKTTRIGAALARADEILANSAWTADQAYRFAGKTPVRVVPLPIPEQPPLNETVRGALKTRVGEAGPLVVTLCRLELRKGVDRLIDAMRALGPKRPGLRLVVAGDGPDRERLERRVARQGLEDRVLFLGRVEEAEKAALLDLADVFAMPVRRDGDSVEGFGLVYLEAGWRGTPSLAGRDGGVADAVKDGETGVLCEGADLRSVTETLARLLDDAALRDRLGAAARTHARAQIWEQRLGDYLTDASAAQPSVSPSSKT